MLNLCQFHVTVKVVGYGGDMSGYRERICEFSSLEHCVSVKLKCTAVLLEHGDIINQECQIVATRVTVHLIHVTLILVHALAICVDPDTGVLHAASVVTANHLPS